MWQPIETAPKSTAVGNRVTGAYLLGFVPDHVTTEPQTGITVIWWEPLQRCTYGKRRGMMGTWMHDIGECEPSHWMELPQVPDVAANCA